MMDPVGGLIVYAVERSTRSRSHEQQRDVFLRRVDQSQARRICK